MILTRSPLEDLQPVNDPLKIFHLWKLLESLLALEDPFVGLVSIDPAFESLHLLKISFEGISSLEASRKSSSSRRPFCRTYFHLSSLGDTLSVFNP